MAIALPVAPKLPDPKISAYHPGERVSDSSPETLFVSCVFTRRRSAIQLNRWLA